MMQRWLLAAALLGGFAGMTDRAEAGLILDLRASQGVDLSSLQIGQSFTVDLFGLGDTPGETIQSASSIYQGTTTPSVGGTGIQVSSTIYNDLSTNPLLATFSFRATQAGSGFVAGGFDNLTTSKGNFYSQIQSNLLAVNVLPAAAPVPEPSSLAGAGVGISLAVVAVLKRRRKVAIA